MLSHEDKVMVVEPSTVDLLNSDYIASNTLPTYEQISHLLEIATKTADATPDTTIIVKHVLCVDGETVILYYCVGFPVIYIKPISCDGFINVIFDTKSADIVATKIFENSDFLYNGDTLNVIIDINNPDSIIELKRTELVNMDPVVVFGETYTYAVVEAKIINDTTDKKLSLLDDVLSKQDDTMKKDSKITIEEKELMDYPKVKIYVTAHTKNLRKRDIIGLSAAFYHYINKQSNNLNTSEAVSFILTVSAACDKKSTKHIIRAINNKITADELYVLLGVYYNKKLRKIVGTKRLLKELFKSY